MKTTPATTLGAFLRPPTGARIAGLRHAECMAAMTLGALAAIRPPRTFSTFSVWRSRQEMTDMVHGRNPRPGAGRHADAMAERNRKDFHHEFTTLRFRSISEHGEWSGRGGFVPE